MYGNKIDFWILILYPSILLNPFISINSIFFLVGACELLGIFLIKRSYHPSYMDAFHLNFCLKSMARTSSTTFNRRSHILVLEQSIWYFTIKCDICCGVFIDAFYQDEKVTLPLLLNVFIIMEWYISDLSLLFFYNMLYNINWLSDIKPNLHYWNKLHLVIMCLFLYIFLCFVC